MATSPNGKNKSKLIMASDGPDSESKGFDRASATAAQGVVEHLYPDPQVRHACLEVLADSILCAHKVWAGSWGLTLHPRQVRLNVGRIEACGLSTGEVWLVLDREHLAAEIREIIVAEGLSKDSDTASYRSFLSAFAVHLPEKICQICFRLYGRLTPRWWSVPQSACVLTPPSPAPIRQGWSTTSVQNSGETFHPPPTPPSRQPGMRSGFFKQIPTYIDLRIP